MRDWQQEHEQTRELTRAEKAEQEVVRLTRLLDEVSHYLVLAARAMAAGRGH